MTRLPFERRNLVKVVEGPDYQIPHFCANPLCDETQIERHHIVRRSEIGGDHAWVEYDGLKIQNLCGLCREHHQQITENKAAIQWQEHMRRYVWVENGGWESGGSMVALSPGPISIDRTPDIVRGETPPFAPEHSEEHTVEAETNSSICPSCKRPFRHKDENEKQEQKKIRKTWALAVPKEEQEDGAEVLDSLLEEARKIMAAGGMVAYSDEKKARYYILSAALSLFVLHAQEVMSDA